MKTKEWYMSRVQELSFEELKAAITESVMDKALKKTFSGFIAAYEQERDPGDLQLIQERFAGWLIKT